MFQSTPLISLLISLLFVGSQSLLAPPSSGWSSRTITSTRLDMAPKYFKDKWVPESDDDLPSAGYDVLGTLLRQGPRPAFTRIFQSDEYEQAVLKFMAGDNCDRNVAQGNMDAYLRNPQDWQYARMEDKKKGYQRDYVTIKAADVALVLVWSSIVSAVIGRGVYCIANGVDFYAFGPFNGSY